MELRIENAYFNIFHESSFGSYLANIASTLHADQMKLKHFIKKSPILRNSALKYIK
jgi:hypothetical protein